MKRILRREAAGLICAFTGHRPNKYPWLNDPGSDACRSLLKRLRGAVEDLIGEGYTHFISGGALGVDTLAALLVLEMREKDPRLTLEIALPCPDQTRYWSARDVRLHKRLCDQADALTTISEIYTPFCMYERNRFMVNACQTLIAVYDGTPGGTRMTVGLAYDEGKRIITLAP